MNNKPESQDCANAIAEIERKVPDWVKRYQNPPEKEMLPVHNDSRASLLNGEIAQLDETLHWIEAAMLELDSEHEQYQLDRNGFCFRHRDHRSVENTEMMFGPCDPCLEDWMAAFRNDLLDSRNELSVDLSITEKGEIGEENVFRELYLHYPTLSNIVLNVADEIASTNETDFYAILPHGVAVIEVKNYGKSGQQVWAKNAPHQWEITTAQGRHLSNNKNPLIQNERHIHATRKVLKGLLDKEIPLFSVIVLGNNQVQIINETDFIVTNPRGLCSALDTLTSDVTLTEQEQGVIMRHLQSLDIGSRSFECPSYRKRNEYIYQLAREIFPVLCNNKAIRSRYYADKKTMSNRLAAVPVGILVLVAVLFRNITAIVECLLCMSLLISGVAVLAPKLKGLLPRPGVSTRNKIVEKIYQEQHQEDASADSNHLTARLGEFNRYLLTEAEHYPIRFDITVPLTSLPERYIPFETLKADFARISEQSAVYIKEHFGLDNLDISHIETLYRMTGNELTLGFQMVRHMCNQSVDAFVGLREAEQYYQAFFQKAHFFCSSLYANVIQHRSGPQVPVETLPLPEELGVGSSTWCRSSNNEILFLYRDELLHAQKILTMLAECHRYAQYLLNLGFMYYEHCGVVVNDDGELFEVSDWNQTFDHFKQLLANYCDLYEITSADFLNAVV